MKVIKADEMGLCSGVKRAFSLVEKVYYEKQGKPLFIYGDLAHNKYVIKKIAEGGFITIYKAEDALPGSVVIIRAHGISDTERSILQEKGVEIVDATCPLVLKNQNCMRSSELDVILLGTKGHSETVAVEGASRRTYFVVQDKEDIDSIPNDRKYRVIVQTTFDTARYNMLMDELEARGYSYIVSNSICMASERRRDSIHALKGQVPFLLVVGDNMSANSKALVSEAERIGLEAALIDDENSIEEEMLKQFSVVGVSAGSSAPDEIIERVVRRLEEL